MNDAGESVFVKFLESGRRDAFAGVGRGGEDLERGPRLPSAISGRRSRPAPIPNGNWGCRSSPKAQAEGFSFDILDATKIVPEKNWCR